MPCPTLADLPPPPAGRTGWPWTAESQTLAEPASEGSWPRISIVIPSFNQVAFLEAALRSVLLQGYPSLEVIVADGGSDDGSVEVLERYEPWLEHWSSGPDGGQYAAVNGGFAHASGDVLAWLNSDDMYVPDALWRVGSIFADLTGAVDWVTGTPAFWTVDGRLSEIGQVGSYRRSWLRAGLYEGRLLGWVQQESTFWSRSLWDASGGIDESLRWAGDFDLWRRFARHGDLYAATTLFGGFRFQPAQKTAVALGEYYAEIDRSRGVVRPWWIRASQRSELARSVIAPISAARGGGPVVAYAHRRGRWEIKR